MASSRFIIYSSKFGFLLPLVSGLIQSLMLVPTKASRAQFWHALHSAIRASGRPQVSARGNWQSARSAFAGE
jgi:hypothetical protein